MILPRRAMVGFLTLLTTGSVAKSATSETTVETHKVAMQVSTNDHGVFDLAMNNAVNLSREFSDLAEEVEIEIVAYGPGVHMFRDDTSPIKPRIKSVTQSIPGIVLTACGNTITAMEQADGRKIELVQGVGIVHAGAVRLVKLQEAGWSYLRV